MLNSAIHSNRLFSIVTLGIAGLLLVPLIVMQVTTRVQWSLFDFIVAAGLLFMAAAAFILAARNLSRKQLAFTAVGLVTALTYIWAELAVGIFFHFGS